MGYLENVETWPIIPVPNSHIVSLIRLFDSCFVQIAILTDDCFVQVTVLVDIRVVAISVLGDGGRVLGAFLVEDDFVGIAVLDKALDEVGIRCSSEIVAAVLGDIDGVIVPFLDGTDRVGDANLSDSGKA